MSADMGRCKITVLKTLVNDDLVREYLAEPEKHPGPCEFLTEGQEFTVDKIWFPPEGFCPWAWADIRKDLLIAVGGGHYPGMKLPGVVITGCSDWFRPVIFKVERI
jgi:uncharacterized repeat protein (TIGR04076 family)